MKSFYKTFPHMMAAKSLDIICDEYGYNDYLRRKIFSCLHTSFIMFKEILKVDYFSYTFLSLSYKERCRVIDETKWSLKVKTHVKNMVHASYNDYLRKSKDKKENKNG